MLFYLFQKYYLTYAIDVCVPRPLSRQLSSQATNNRNVAFEL